MAMERMQAMLGSCATDSPVLPPTLLYNEGWLLRVVVDWFSTRNVADHPLTFSRDARWFSEALLPSAFLATKQGDRLAESWTHADGVIGHFEIGKEGKTDLSLQPDARQLVVLEAKMFAPLSSGVRHARYFDQAARTVACVAEVLKRANRHPSELSRLGLYVLAPRCQVDQRIFNKRMDRDSIQRKVERRVELYEGRKDQWFADWFGHTLQQIKIGVSTWEELIKAIREHDPSSADSIHEFYGHCLRLNQQSNKVPA